MNKELLTVDQLAKFLSVPKSWIYGKSRMKSSDAIPRIKVGKYLRFELDQVLTWLRSRQDWKE